MPSRSSKPPLAIGTLFQVAAADIRGALAKARVLHSDLDIDAAGHEVEGAVRSALADRLPTNAYVGYGHVVDNSWKTSKEWDLIVADRRTGPVFFSAEDGTEYFPYESVAAVGEVKSAYRKNKRPIHALVRDIRELKDSLVREATPKSYLPTVGRINGVTWSGPWPYRNPLFCCAIFADSAGFKIDDIEPLFQRTPWRYLPNVICFLDLGIVALFEVSADHKQLANVVEIPEFVDPSTERAYEWVLIPFGDDAVRMGANLGFLYLMLAQHIQRAVLGQPNLWTYFARGRLLDWPAGAEGVVAKRIAGDVPPVPVP